MKQTQRLAAKNRLNADERQQLKALERENRELRGSNDILRQASAYFPQAELEPPRQEIASLTVPLMEQHGV